MPNRDEGDFQATAVRSGEKFSRSGVTAIKNGIKRNAAAVAPPRGDKPPWLRVTVPGAGATWQCGRSSAPTAWPRCARNRCAPIWPNAGAMAPPRS